MTSQNYMKVLMNESCFDRKTLLNTMRNCGEQISDALFKVRLQDMLRSGDIIRVGRNAYCIPKENVYSYEYEYSDRAKEVAEKIRERYPYLEFTIFEMAQLNEFVNHQLAHNIIFVSVESELENFVFDTLKEEYPGKVLVNPTPDIYHQYWYGDMIVIEHLITEAPKDKDNVWASRLEKILVDIQTDPILLSSLSESEYPGIYEQCFEKYRIDESSLFRYAKRRGAEKKILEFIQTKTEVKLRTRR